MIPTFEIHHGDSFAVLKTLPDNSIDSCVTDPSYGLSEHSLPDTISCLRAWLAGEEFRPKKKGFMGHSWDAWVPGPEVWKEVYRVLKPGAHLLAFAGTRSMDLMCMAIRLAGFEMRDSIGYANDDGDGDSDPFQAPLMAWCYGSGFPKSMDVSKAIDKAAGAERQVIGQEAKDYHAQRKTDHTGKFETYMGKGDGSRFRDITAPATDAARQWEGWGTALKPAWEPVIIARKPLVGTVAENVIKYGTGALNIDGCRIPSGQDHADKCASVVGLASSRTKNTYAVGDGKPREDSYHASGRWPANVIHDGSPEVLAHFPDSDGAGGSIPNVKITGYGDGIGTGTSEYFGGDRQPFESGTGSAARFFYCSKASRSERNEGLFSGDVPAVATNATMREREDADWKTRNGNFHPTVKPVDLIRYLWRLVTPPGGKGLDLFAGSGSHGVAAILEGFDVVLIEGEEEYIPIIEARCRHAVGRYENEHRQMGLDLGAAA